MNENANFNMRVARKVLAAFQKSIKVRNEKQDKQVNMTDVVTDAMIQHSKKWK